MSAILSRPQCVSCVYIFSYMQCCPLAAFNISHPTPVNDTHLFQLLLYGLPLLISYSWCLWMIIYIVCDLTVCMKRIGLKKRLQGSVTNTVEPLWKGQESITKVAKFGPFPCTILYKSCLFYPSWQATSFERPLSWVAFIERFNCSNKSVNML